MLLDEVLTNVGKERIAKKLVISQVVSFIQLLAHLNSKTHGDMNTNVVI